MGNAPSLFACSDPVEADIGFDVVQRLVERPRNEQTAALVIIISTMPEDKQACLITGTVSSILEEGSLNEIVERKQQRNWSVVVYGENHMDQAVNAKCKQLRDLGFGAIYCYKGGMFEWLLLQETHGLEHFPTTSRVGDILRFKPRNRYTSSGLFAASISSAASRHLIQHGDL